MHRIEGSTASIRMMAERDSRGRRRKMDSAPPLLKVRVEEMLAARSRLACVSALLSGVLPFLSGPAPPTAGAFIGLPRWSTAGVEGWLEGLDTALLLPLCSSATVNLEGGRVPCLLGCASPPLVAYLLAGTETIESLLLGNVRSEGSLCFSWLSSRR